MKLKSEVLFKDAFGIAFQKLLKLEFPATISLQIISAVKVLAEQQKNVFAVRDSLVSRCIIKSSSGGIAQDDGSIKFIDDEKREEFNKEMRSLLDTEFDIPIKEKIKLTDKIQITGNDILILQDIIDLG